MSAFEKKFLKECKKRGYVILKSGWPDFLVIPPEGRPYCIEVKSMFDRLKPNQRRMIYVLKKLGIETYISFDGEWRDPYANHQEKFDLDELYVEEAINDEIITIIRDKKNNHKRRDFNTKCPICGKHVIHLYDHMEYNHSKAKLASKNI